MIHPLFDHIYTKERAVFAKWEGLEFPTCQYEVPVNYGPDRIDDCGRIASARVWWAEDESDSMFVCEEHAWKIEESEQDDASTV